MTQGLSLREKTELVGMEGGIDKVSVYFYRVHYLWNSRRKMLVKQTAIWTGGKF